MVAWASIGMQSIVSIWGGASELELDRRLEALKHGGILKTFHDRRIGPGLDWDGEIAQELRDADLCTDEAIAKYQEAATQELKPWEATSMEEQALRVADRCGVFKAKLTS
jgi:hypothetical protein